MLNTNVYGVTNGTFSLRYSAIHFLQNLHLPVWIWDPYLIGLTSFLTRPTSQHSKTISIQCAIFSKFTKRLTDEQTDRTMMDLNR